MWDLPVYIIGKEPAKNDLACPRHNPICSHNNTHNPRVGDQMSTSTAHDSVLQDLHGVPLKATSFTKSVVGSSFSYQSHDK